LCHVFIIIYFLSFKDVSSFFSRIFLSKGRKKREIKSGPIPLELDEADDDE
jgi:hypothetical protein